MCGWCSRANQSESLIGLAFHCDDVMSMECWLFWGHRPFSREEPSCGSAGGMQGQQAGGPIEVTRLVSNGIKSWLVQIQLGSKNFFLFFSEVIFLLRPVVRGKNWIWVVVLLHSTFVDMRTSVERE